jgi:hypothetical protein
MTKNRRSKRTATEIAFGYLAYEFPRDEVRKTDSKIKRGLRSAGFRRFPQSKIEILRTLKTELQTEIGRGMKSPYFLKCPSRHAGLYDFAIDQLTHDLVKRFPAISVKRMRSFVCFAVFLYWMR